MCLVYSAFDFRTNLHQRKYVEECNHNWCITTLKLVTGILKFCLQSFWRPFKRWRHWWTCVTGWWISQIWRYNRRQCQSSYQVYMYFLNLLIFFLDNEIKCLTELFSALLKAALYSWRKLLSGAWQE